MTPSKEDYLKTIVELGGENQVVNNKQLVQALRVSAASVTDMNAKLLKEGLITHIPYKGVQVTEKGLRIANQLIRKHRIWEVFLAEKLGYDWKEVHADADRLEHVSSDLLIERLFQFLGEPEVDPHGGKIPNKDGTTDSASFCQLIDLDIGEPFLIKEVDDDTDLLEYLTQKGIQLGAHYRLVDKEPYEGPLTLESPDGSKTILGYKAALNIFVEKMEV